MKIVGFKAGKCVVCGRPARRTETFECSEGGADKVVMLAHLQAQRDTWLAEPVRHFSC